MEARQAPQDRRTRVRLGGAAAAAAAPFVVVVVPAPAPRAVANGGVVDDRRWSEDGVVLGSDILSFSPLIVHLSVSRPKYG